MPPGQPCTCIAAALAVAAGTVPRKVQEFHTYLFKSLNTVNRPSRTLCQFVCRGVSYAFWETRSYQSAGYFFCNLFILCIYFWLRWVFVAAHRLSLVAPSGGYSSLWCTGFSLRWLLLLQSTGSRPVGFSSCGSRSHRAQAQ